MNRNGAPSFKDDITWMEMLSGSAANMSPTVSPMSRAHQSALAGPFIPNEAESSHHPELHAQNHENVHPRPLAQNSTQTTGNRVGILRTAAPPNTGQHSMNSPSSSLGVHSKAVVDPNDLISRLSILPSSVSSLPQSVPAPLQPTDDNIITATASYSGNYGPVTPPPDIQPAVASELVVSPPLQNAGSQNLTEFVPATSRNKSGTFSEFGSLERRQLFQRRPRYDSQPDPSLLDINTTVPIGIDSEITDPDPVLPEINPIPPAGTNNGISDDGDEAETFRNLMGESVVGQPRRNTSWLSTLRKKSKVMTPEDDIFRGRLSRKDPAIEAANKYYDKTRKLANQNKGKDLESSNQHSRQTSGVLGDAIEPTEGDAQNVSGSRSPISVRNEKKTLQGFLKFWRSKDQTNIDASQSRKSKKVNGHLKGKSSATLVDTTSLGGDNTEVQAIQDSPPREETGKMDTLPRRLVKKISKQLKAVTCSGTGKEQAAQNQDSQADEASGDRPQVISQNKNSVRRRAVKNRVSSIFRWSREESSGEACPVLQGERSRVPSDAFIENTIANARVKQARLPPTPSGSMSFAIPSNIPKSYR